METTLKEMALFKVTEELCSLGEVLDFCRDNVQFADVYPHVPEFWKKTIARFMNSYWIKQRGDLQTGEEWYAYAIALRKPKLVNYKLSRFGDDWGRRVTTIWSLTGTNFPFDIYNIQPRPGMTAYVAILEWNDITPTTGCFLHNDPREAFILAAQFAGETFRNALQVQLDLHPDIKAQVWAGSMRYGKCPSYLPPHPGWAFDILDDKSMEMHVTADFGTDDIPSVDAIVYLRPIIF
jgi:hypothetical protein